MQEATRQLLVAKLLADPTILQRYRETSQAAYAAYHNALSDEDTTLGTAYSCAVQAMSVCRKYADILEIVLQLTATAEKCRQIVGDANLADYDAAITRDEDTEEEIEF